MMSLSMYSLTDYLQVQSITNKSLETSYSSREIIDAVCVCVCFPRQLVFLH